MTFEDDDHELDAYGQALLDQILSDIPATLGNQLWRLQNLYYVHTQNDGVQLFKMWPMQRHMYRERWYRNLILKVRQIGSSTFWCIFLLDSCLFGDDPVRGQIIAQDVPASKKLLVKCRFAFDRLNPGIKSLLGVKLKPPTSSTDITFSNGSAISCGASGRSSTIDILVISEMGKISARSPQRAEEVISGSLPTLTARGIAIMESTAEGNDGRFFDLIETAGEIAESPSRVLGRKDWKLHFFAWWERPEYIDHDPYEFSDDHRVYFDKLLMRGIVLTLPQKNWWARNKDIYRDRMASEYPSYREEAFMVATRGLYLAKQMITCEEERRVGDVAFRADLPCVCSWDLGANTAIWIYQYYSPTHMIYLDYLEGEGGDFAYWADRLNKLAAQKGYTYAGHAFPWDGGNKVGMTSTMKLFAEDAGLEDIQIIDKRPHTDQIRVAQLVMASCWFDLAGTMLGRKRIMGYRKRFDPLVADFIEEPLKNIASHGAEAWITGLFFDPSGLTMPADPPIQSMGGGHKRVKWKFWDRGGAGGDRQSAMSVADGVATVPTVGRALRRLIGR